MQPLALRVFFREPQRSCYRWLDNSDEHKHIHLHYQHSYTCNQTDYNAMSMLWLNGGVKGVKVLMQRGFPHMLSWEVLLVFFCVYFVLASYTSGTSVPAGLIVPMLLLGNLLEYTGAGRKEETPSLEPATAPGA